MNPEILGSRASLTPVVRHRHSFHSSRHASRLYSLDPTHCSRALRRNARRLLSAHPRAYVFPPPVFTEITRHA